MSKYRFDFPFDEFADLSEKKTEDTPPQGQPRRKDEAAADVEIYRN